MKIEVEVTSRKIADQMVTAIEGGSTYWCNKIWLVESTKEPSAKPWYDSPELYEDEGVKIEVTEDEDEENQDSSERPLKHIIQLKDIKDGLELMASKFPQHFADIINESEDATTADVFLQCVVLRALMYG